MIYSVSYFNSGAGASVGGLSPPKPHVATGLVTTSVNSQFRKELNMTRAMEAGAQVNLNG